MRGSAEKFLLGRAARVFPTPADDLTPSLPPLSGVILNQKLSGFEDDVPTFPHLILDGSLPQLRKCRCVPEAMKQLESLLPHALSLEACDTRPLHALSVEKLPTWKKEKTQQRGRFKGKRYGDHLGVGIYVWDEARNKWYLRMLHGRSRSHAYRFPLMRPKTAQEKLSELKRKVERGTYNSLDETNIYLPPHIKKAYA